jgi:hypothetical protein
MGIGARLRRLAHKINAIMCRLKFIVSAAFASLVFFSCHIKKKLVKPANVIYVANPNGKDSLLRQKWEYLNARLGVDYFSDKEEQALNFAIRMRRDSLIWFTGSLVMPGIQVLKGIITKDSLIALDLFSKKYYRYGIRALENKFGIKIGLHELQNLFISNPVLDSLTYQRDSISGAWMAQKSNLQNFQFTRNFSVPDSIFLIQAAGNRQFKTYYQGNFTAGKLNLAQFIDMLAISESKTVRLQIEFKTASDEFIPSYPFSIPKDYEDGNQ